MKKVVYRWYLSSDNGETKQRVYPIYKGDLTLDYELESGQQFHRAKLSGKIDFVGEDYDWIMSQDLENDTIQVYLQISYDNLATKSLYWQGHFTLTDMEVNADDKRIVVQPQVDDKYSTLLNGIETEYDLIRDLSPTKSTLNLVKGSIMQIAVAKGLTSSYFFNDYIDSVQGVDVWQEDTATDATSSNIMSTFKFGVGGRTISMIVTPVADSNGDMPDENIAGTYVGVYNANTYFCELFNMSSNSGYYITYEYGIDATTYTKLYDGNNTLLYQGIAVFHPDVQQASVTLTSEVASAKGKLVINATPYVFYTRLLTDTDAETLTIMGDTINVESRPLEDITAYSLNYKKLATLADNFMDYVAISSRVTSSAIQNKTIYGRNSNGDYWLPPTDNQFYLPVAQTLWSGNTSLWVYANGSAVEVEAAQKDYRLNDAYNIADVISALLQKIDPTITHQASTAYSQFLYGVNPISETNERLFITPKSNVLSSEYSQAAQKGVITLKMVLDMLAKVYQCYWWVDGNNRLRIEHISYLMQGNSYTTGSMASVGVDLTTLLNTRNGKAWDYNKNSWTYEKYDMPERIVFKWMDDDVSNIFEGYPIVLQSPFIEKAKKDEQSVSNFTTDIDRMLAVPSAFSKDGFAMITAIDLNQSHIGQTITFSGQDYVIALQPSAAGALMTIEAECSNTSGQSKTIEYGWEDNGVYNKIGELQSGTTAVANTFTIVMPTEYTLLLVFKPEGSGYSNSVKFNSITGGNQYISQRETLNGYFIQNYHLSFDWLLPMFWKYNLPCPNVIFNNEQTATTTTLIQRNRTQNVKWPIGAKADPDCEKLVKTDLGEGMIRKMSVNLSSRVATANLKQDTYAFAPVIHVPAPTITPEAGEITLSQQITISISGIATSAEYSTDNETWTTYTSPFTLASDAVVYARAKDDNGSYSSVINVSYTVLPYDSKVEYLETTNADAYISVPTNATSSCTVEIDGYVSTTNKELFGFGSNYYQFNIESSGTYYRWWSSSPLNMGAGYLGTRHKYTCSQQLYVDGVLKGSVTINQTGSRSVFNILYGSHGIANGRIYSAKLSDAETNYDLIPVRLGSVGYMYDKLSGQLIGKTGSGNFAYGSDVN